MKRTEVRDYHYFTTKDTPEVERRKFNVGDVWNNSVKCKKCGEIIISKNRHDYVECKCKAIAVDGGSWYCSRVGELEAYEELSEAFSDYKGTA